MLILTPLSLSPTHARDASSARVDRRSIEGGVQGGIARRFSTTEFPIVADRKVLVDRAQDKSGLSRD